MTTQVFRYNVKRVFRNLFFLIPLAAFILVLHFLHLDSNALYILFSVIAVMWIIGSISPALRFRVTVKTEGDDASIDCRGRVLHRTLKLADITKLEIRKRRQKATRWLRTLPFRDLVLHNKGKRLIISSLSLGDEAFDRLTELLQSALPPEALQN